MIIAEKIYEQAMRLPEHLAREVLDFIEYIEIKHGLADLETQNLKQAQLPVMTRLWDNEEDGVWDEHPSC